MKQSLYRVGGVRLRLNSVHLADTQRPPGAARWLPPRHLSRLSSLSAPTQTRFSNTLRAERTLSPLPVCCMCFFFKVKFTSTETHQFSLQSGVDKCIHLCESGLPQRSRAFRHPGPPLSTHPEKQILTRPHHYGLFCLFQNFIPLNTSMYLCPVLSLSKTSVRLSMGCREH